MAASADNKALARLFYRMSKILDLKGENPFKAIAFFKVKDVLETMPQDVRGVWQQGGLKAVKGINGIGDSSAKIISDWLETGSSPDYDSLATSIPEGLVDMLGVPRQTVLLGALGALVLAAVVAVVRSRRPRGTAGALGLDRERPARR